MFKKGKKIFKAFQISNLWNLCNLRALIKIIILVFVLFIFCKAFIQIPQREQDLRYYVDITNQNEAGETFVSKIKILEARALCHSNALGTVQNIASSEEEPENFNPNEFYENGYIFCLRSIGL